MILLLTLSIWNPFNFLVSFMFMDLSEALVKGVLSMSCNSFIDLGLVWIGRFEPFRHHFETLVGLPYITFISLSPPCWIDDWVERS